MAGGQKKSLYAGGPEGMVVRLVRRIRFGARAGQAARRRSSQTSQRSYSTAESDASKRPL
ncbi:hypothetical protein M407DRAFT_246572, partial [Tulasnella calospora MUT 4182]